jgi:Cu(I)/Ag(I) efflux system periplasmic protein CusF
MKRVFIAVLLATFAVAAWAQNAASGVVKKVDAASGKATIAHGPVPSLKWPAMTMGFVVKDKKLLDKLKVDRKVDFEFVQQGKDYVITSVK